LNMYGKRRVGRSSAKSARSGREPWLLASGAGVQHLTAAAIVACRLVRKDESPGMKAAHAIQRASPAHRILNVTA
jgi:hypothetical protein